MHFDPLILIIGLWIGLAKGGLGGAVAGAIILPLLSQTMTVPQAVGITLPLLIIGDSFAMRSYWREWDADYIRLMLPISVVGVVIGAILLDTLPEDILRRTLGIITLLIVAYNLLSSTLNNITYYPRNWHGYLAGATGGVSSALANAGGPPIAAYLLLQDLKPSRYVATFTLYFFIVNLLKVPIFVAQGVIKIEYLINTLWVMPVILLGVLIGRWVVERMNPTLFRWLIIVALVWSSWQLLFN